MNRPAPAVPIPLIESRRNNAQFLRTGPGYLVINIIEFGQFCAFSGHQIGDDSSGRLAVADPLSVMGDTVIYIIDDAALNLFLNKQNVDFRRADLLGPSLL